MQSKRLSRSVRLQRTMLGCYRAERAAALSGVPRDRLHAWARAEVVVPSVAHAREQRLWSYTDLLALRLTWLRATAAPGGSGRRGRPGHRGLPDPRAELRRALTLLADWAPGGDGGPDGQPAPLLADQEGNLALHSGPRGAADAAGPQPDGTWARGSLPDGSLPDGTVPEGTWVDLFARFDTAGASGPDLVTPRPHLRIVPGKVAGEPHLAGSRLTTLAVAALARRGLTLDEIGGLFPDQQRAALAEAVDLEHELAAGAHAQAT